MTAIFGQCFCCLLLFFMITTRNGKFLCIFETTITSTMYFIPVHCRLHSTHPTFRRSSLFFIFKASPSKLHFQAFETHVASVLQEATQSRSVPSFTRFLNTCNLQGHCDYPKACPLLRTLVHIVGPRRPQANYHAFKLREDVSHEAEWEPEEPFEA